MKRLIAILLLFVAPSAVRAADVDLLLVAGQSNAVGYDAKPGELPKSDADQHIMFWWKCGDPPPDMHDSSSGKKWLTLQAQPLGDPQKPKQGRQYGNFAQPEGGFGPEIGFARTLFAKQEKPLAVVKAAFSGTGMKRDWNHADAGEGGSCYRALVEETQAAIKAGAKTGITFRIRALVWVQGESDANATDAPNYAIALGGMLDALRKDLDAPNLVALIAVNTKFGNGGNKFMPQIVEQQKLLAARDARCEYVDTAEATIANSAHYDSKGTLEVGRMFAEKLLEHEAKHWSLLPIGRPRIPSDPVLKDVDADRATVRNPIDAFVLRKLAALKIAPSAEAADRTLIRRVTLDLIGLPPTPDEVAAFLEDQQPDRYERLVDRLLASPQYGERWATPWLDLCHYADTDGYLTDQLRPVAWRYRTWLVEALNRNQPFDEFTIEQLAGDLLPNATTQQRIATGFLRQTLSNREGGAEPEEFRVKQVVDRTEMVGAIWLGLTVGCARCHDHKYDPISQREFYELYACFDNTDEINIDAPLRHEADAFSNSRTEYERRRRELIEPLSEPIEELQRRWEAKCLEARANPGRDHTWDRQWELVGLIWGGGLGEGQLEGQEIMRLPWPQRTARQRDDLLDYFLQRGSLIDEARWKEFSIGALQGKLQALVKEFPQATRAPVMHASLNTRQTYIHVAGAFRDPGPNVSPGTLGCLPSWNRDAVVADAAESTAATQDARLAMARWLVSQDNPLTARVTVNRMWERFFGRGLVVTTEDFGSRGQRPSQPDLLDWLAAEFLRTGWNIKAMHRLIVTSATYRRSSEYRTDLATVDPENVWLARQSSLRISAESIRDVGLAVSGLLFEKQGGPCVKPAQSERVTMEGFGNQEWKTSPAPECYRRGLYTFAIRTTPFAQGIIFDAPNPNEICTRRVRSNTPLQALTLLNDPVFFEMAQQLASRICTEPADDSKRIGSVFRICVSREPTNREIELVQNLLRAEREGQQTEDAVWTTACSVVLNLHEFITRD